MAASEREPIAVVGIGCRFPGGVSTATEFWETLQQGIDVIGDVPKDRFDSSSFYDKDPQKYGTIRNCKGGFLDDIKSFDADFFGYFPVEASRIDPQQRLALEASVHALQDSGTPLQKVSGSRTSVFLGTFMYDHLSIQAATEQRDGISPHTTLGSMIWATANRVSHRLNLQGPSITLDTACSSSLSALHLACQSIWAGESEGALAGGVNAILRPESTIMLSKSGFLSPDGTCKPFDASANGYVRSEGVGIVYLKPLSTAIQDKDRIYACIRGSLVNQDGYTADGFTVPSLAAQATLLKTVYSQSNIDPTRVQYIEAHGPGTLVGDPVEANALGKQLGQKRSEKQEPLWIGSVKGNYGHLEGAAGIIGFIKASLVAFYGEIPPQANNTTLNPSIDFESLRLKISRDTVRLPRDQERKVVVGVNSFGAGGANAHVILEEAPNDLGTGAGKSHRRPRVFNLSAKSQSALAHTARDLASFLRLRKHSLEDVAYTLNMRRDKHTEFSVIPAQGLHELCSRLDQLGSQQASKNTLTLQKLSGISRPRVAFLFSGQGGQWLGMGMRLAYQEPTFREHLAAFDNIFASLAHFSIIEEMFGQSDDSRLSKTTIAQPAIAAIQIALARTLISYGIKPESCVGHSIGEISAAHICGALSLEDAVKIIYFRSQIQSKAAGTGSMLATGMSAKEADNIIQRVQAGGSVEIAALNGPKTTTLTGDIESLENVARELEKRNVFARFVKVDTPYHSRFMDPLEGELVEALSPIQGTPTELDLYSTVTTTVESGKHLTASYWFENIRKPVKYTETANRMIEDGFNFLIEIGPHPVLISGTRDIAEASKRPVYLLPGMLRGNDVESMSRVIGATHAVGIPVDISSFNGGGGKLIDLPLYPFQRQHYYFEDPEAQQSRLAESRHPFLRSSASLTDDEHGALRLRLSTGVSPFLSDHVINGAIVFPMTGHVEAAYLAANKFLKQPRIWLEDLRFELPVVLAAAEDFAPQIISRRANASPTAAWHVCSRGRINARDMPPRAHAEAIDSMNTDAYYQQLEEAGFRYGKSFRCIQEMWRFGEELFSLVELPPSLVDEASRFNFHPALLDACVHTAYAYQHHVGNPHVDIMNDYPVTSVFAHIQIHHLDHTFLKYDLTIYGHDGQLLQSKTLTQSKEHRVSFQLETEEPSKRGLADFENVLILDPPGSLLNWLLPTVQSAFPRSRVYEKGLEAVEPSWKTSEWGFSLDRRTLLIVPALSGPSQGQIHKNLDAAIQTLTRIASWIRAQSGVYTQCNPFASSVEAATRVMVNEFQHRQTTFLEAELQTLRFDRFVRRILMLKSLPARGGKQQSFSQLGPDEVGIEVHAAGLSYRDVLNAMGSLSDRAISGGLTGQNLGLEVSGHIDRGALVMARVPNGISGYAVTRYDLVAPVPSSLSVTQAACVLVSGTTAYYALEYLGAGGHIGARVYATAGSPARRAWVSDMGAEALATQGRGVDVVLNCLPGTMFSQSMACLAPFGRFLEIGKTDIYRNTKLGLEKLGQNCAFFAPKLHRQIVREVCKLLGQGILLSVALKQLSRSSVIGKAAVELPSDVNIEAMPPKHLKLDGTRSYLITGGTSGLGLHLARFLVERGARHLVLVSRTGPKTPEDHALISHLRHKGVSVNIETEDISNIQAAEFLFDQHRPWPPIAGVIHSAGVLETISAHGVTSDNFRTVFAPKALGAWNLHQTTQGLHLDFFVLVSSVSSILGVAGQLSYAAANQFLDGLAQHRQASGLPGTSLNLGVLGDYAGMSRTSSGDNRVVRLAESEGLSVTDLPTVLSALERALIYSTSQTMISSIDWSMFIKAYPHLAYDGAYLGLDKQQEADKNDGSQVFSSRLSGPEREQAIRDTLQAGLAKILGVDTSRISATEKIDQYSLDSMTLTQLRGLILREFRTPYPLIKLFEGPSLQEVAAELNGTSQDTQLADKDTTNVGDDQLGSMSDDGLIKISPWFVRGSSANAHCPRLLCIHSMGAAATLFASFLSSPPDGLDPIAMQLPGRASRSDEPPASSIPEVVSGLLNDMENVVGYPAIIWGHSFGGIIAFETIRALRRHGKPLPRLLVTGTIAPSLISVWQRRDILVEVVREDINPDYWMSVARYVDDVEYLRSIMPLMRQDGPLLLKYQFTEEAPLNIPITAFTARQDDLVYAEEISAWGKETKDFRLIEVDGDHWFLYRNRVLLRETLAAMACDLDTSEPKN
ncbi:fatty acid synthase S-acetyltransferase [Aspergillus taichungensis]|uniref:Fatty acid synthase S-acetyltransferase n=1 Tax=Aspergillus taichungensis TaxID=482145 RepID=A0A2J5HKH4_9EURO|nr:fatty acid synthase S-acetyltransferase [Aspergillus taichungensis]